MDAGRALRSSWPGDCSEWQHSKRLKSLPAAWNPQSCQYSLQGVWQAKRSDASDVSVVERTSAEDGWSFAWPIHLSSFISLKCSSTNTQLSPFQNTVLTNMHHMPLFCIFTKLFSLPEIVFPGHQLRQHRGHFLTSLLFIPHAFSSPQSTQVPREGFPVPSLIPTLLLPPGSQTMFSPFSSVAQSCPTLCDPTDYSMLGFPVHHQFPEPIQIHVHRAGDDIQPFHSLSSPSPPLTTCVTGAWNIKDSSIQREKLFPLSLDIKIKKRTSLVVQCRGHGFNPWSRKIPHAAGQLSPCAPTTDPVCSRAFVLQQEKSSQ